MERHAKPGIGCPNIDKAYQITNTEFTGEVVRSANLSSTRFNEERTRGGAFFLTKRSTALAVPSG